MNTFREYLIRPLSPSLTMSELDKSSFSFAGSFEINKFIRDMHLAEYEFSDQISEVDVFEVRAQEIEEQIRCIKELYEKELLAHDRERKEFEEKFGKIRIRGDFFQEIQKKHEGQVAELKKIIENVCVLQSKILNVPK